MLAVLMVPISFMLDTLYSLKKGKLYPKLGIRANYMIAILYVIISALIALYLITNFYALNYVRFGSYNIYDIAIGLLALVLVMEYARRKHFAIFLLNLFLIFYALYGRLFPSIFYHPGIRPIRLITAMSVEFEIGMFERLPQLALTLIAAFTLFSSIADGFGIIRSMVKVVTSIARKSLRIIPQACVLNSIIIGLPTGSIAANAAASGVFTIPLMKKVGIPKKLAGAIEGASAVAAQISPPLMGLAAFLMADFLSVSYFEVMMRGWTMTFVYLIGLIFITYLIGRKYIRITESASSLDLKAEIKLRDKFNTLLFIFGIALITYLMWIGMAPLYAAFLTSMVLLAIIVPATILFALHEASALKDVLKELGNNLRSFIENFASEVSDVTLLLSTLGIMTGLFTLTGVPPKIGFLIMEIGHIHPLIAIALAFAFGYVVGLGLTPAPTYLLTAIVIVPCLTDLGFNPWVVHFFAFFMGLFSELSPPTSVASAVTSKISGAGFTETMIELMKVSGSLFLMMFALFTKPWLASEIGIMHLAAAGITTISIIGFAFSIFGGFSRKKLLDISLRTILLLSSLIILHPNINLSILAAILTVGLVVLGLYKQRY